MAFETGRAVLNDKDASTKIARSAFIRVFLVITYNFRLCSREVLVAANEGFVT
jgi:hypothetical protein